MNIPEGDCFDSLPTGFVQNSLLSLLTVRQSGDGSQISCGICKKKSAEISYYFACENLLCCDCVNAHELFRESAFQGHKVTAVKQFQAEDYEALLKRQSFCPQPYHKREVTRFFCLECRICVCQVCIKTDHKNHNVDPIEKAADAEKTDIRHFSTSYCRAGTRGFPNSRTNDREDSRTRAGSYKSPREYTRV